MGVIYMSAFFIVIFLLLSLLFIPLLLPLLSFAFGPIAYNYRCCFMKYAEPHAMMWLRDTIYFSFARGGVFQSYVGKWQPLLLLQSWLALIGVSS